MSELTQAEKEWIETTVDCPRQGRRGLPQPFRRRGQAIAWVEFTGPDYVEFMKIEALPNAATGEASKLLKHLIGICDSHDLEIFGNPESYRPDEWLADRQEKSQECLVRWYERHGFKVWHNAGGWFMKRSPKSRAAPSA